jgi:hypothetical protein
VVLTAPTAVLVSYTGTTTLTFTVTTGQLLDSGGLWVEIFEKTMPGGIQYLGGGATQERHLSRGPRSCAPAQATYVATLRSISNTCPPGGLVASSKPGDTSALGDLPGGQRDDAYDHDEPRAVPVRQQVERYFPPDQGERRNAARSLNTRRLECESLESPWQDHP